MICVATVKLDVILLQNLLYCSQMIGCCTFRLSQKYDKFEFSFIQLSTVTGESSVKKN